MSCYFSYTRLHLLSTMTIVNPFNEARASTKHFFRTGPGLDTVARDRGPHDLTRLDQGQEGR